MPDDSTTCNTCGEPQNAAGYCINKQCSRHGRRNDYLANDAAPAPDAPAAREVPASERFTFETMDEERTRLKAENASLRDAAKSLLMLLDEWAWTAHHTVQSPGIKATVAQADMTQRRNKLWELVSLPASPSRARNE